MKATHIVAVHGARNLPPPPPWERSDLVHPQGFGNPPQGYGISMGNVPMFTPDPGAPVPEMDPMPEADLQEAAFWLGRLYSRAEGVVDEVKTLTGIKTSSNFGLVSCPYDSRHTMPSSALLQHWLRCPSSPAGLSTEAAQLLSSLSYLHKEDEGKALSCLPRTAQQIWYGDAPGPVRASQLRPGTEPDAPMPEVIRAIFQQREAVETFELPEADRLLPSQVWLLEMEVRRWTDFPESYSHTVMVTATGIDRVVKHTTEWLLVHSCEYGIVLDPVLASHVYVLVKPVLAAVRNEAVTCFTSRAGCNAENVVCPLLSESMNWLSSQLSCLYQPMAATALVLGLLKDVLITSARSIQVLSAEAGNASAGHNEKQLSMPDYEVAKRALRERADLESYVAGRVHLRSMSSSSYVQEYDQLVKLAAEERLSRPNYKPLPEHDGLIWHRQQEEDSTKSNRKKTKQELLAQERENKRRRMSYKGKKPKRTTQQVLHDIIERQMKEIRAAGGIGCFANSTTDKQRGQEPGSSTDGLTYEGNSSRDQRSDTGYRNRHHEGSYSESRGRLHPERGRWDREEEKSWDRHNRSSYKSYHDESEDRERYKRKASDIRDRR